MPCSTPYILICNKRSPEHITRDNEGLGTSRITRRLYDGGTHRNRRGKMVFERVKKLVGGGSEDEGNSGGDNVVMPTNSGVLKKTAKEVDLPRDEIREAVERFQEAGAMAYPVIDEKAVRDDDEKSSKPGEDDGPSFFYVIYEDDEVLVVGGAKSLIRTFADRLNLTKTEARAVTTAHRLAGNRNGFSEHIVMDDIFMVPKKGGSDVPELEGMTERTGSGEEKVDGIQEVEENGFAIDANEVFEDPPSLEEQKHFGVAYGCEDGTITLTLDPNATGDEPHHAVIQPEGEILIPREIAVGLEIQHRDIDWERDDGIVVGRMENGRMEKEVVDTVKTKLAMDNIEEEVQAHLPGSHTGTLGVSEDDEVALHLEPEGDEFAMVLSSDAEDSPVDRTVTIKNIGTGTEMLCFAVPDEVADVLGVNDDEERQVEWGLRGDELVGTVVS